MTKPPKTMEEIRDAEAEKYSGVEATDSDVALWSELSKAFKAGFDCRDKLGDESLKIAVEALEFYADGESWSTIDHSKIPTTYDRLEYDKDLGDGDFQITEDTDDSNVSGLRARKSLAEIRKLRGEG